MVDDKEMTNITFQIEKDLKDRFETKSKLNERTLSASIRHLMKQYLGENENE